VAYRVLSSDIDPGDAAAVAQAADETRIAVVEGRVMLAGRDVTDALKTERVSNAASHVALNPRVRERLVELQREAAEGRDLVTEGRDQGTVVFPNAEVKVFLTATPECRAERRLGELRERGEVADYEELLRGIRERDDRDVNRAIAPLVPASGAHEIDSSDLTIDELVDRLAALVAARSASRST